MVQEGIDLVFVVIGAGVAAVVDSNALLPPPPPPTSPLQQHDCEHSRLHPVHAAGVGREARDNTPSPAPSPSPTILIGGGAANNVRGHCLIFPS
jgi:hypothetical protein